MKHPQRPERKDYTMIQILCIAALCAISAIYVVKQVNIPEPQQAVLVEKMFQKREISPALLQVNKKHQKKETVQHEIDQPSVGKQEYKSLTLANDLKVLIVYDPDSKMGSAALNVHAGSWNEPKEYPGLAHFLEHMLFQGSETYPLPSNFEKMIASGGGSTNAYTQPTRTNYYFEVTSGQFLSALDVFAHFFIDPKLSPDMVQKEANAVNSEYEINVSGDSWKVLHLLSLLSSDSHPMSRFTIGNLQSLNKPNIVDALREFHEKFYSSNLMALVLRSNIPIETVQEYLTQSEFLKVTNKQLQRPSFAKFGYPISSLGQMIKYHTNSKTTSMMFIYQLQDDSVHFRTKPISFINSLVKSRHNGGLYSHLISKNLATDMDAAPLQQGNGNVMFYLIEVEGDKENYLIIAQTIISYFDLMVKSYFNDDFQGNALLKSHYQSKADLSQVQFKYLQKEIDIFKLSHNLNTYDVKNVLNGDKVLFEFDDQVIYNYMADLLNPQNMVILIGDEQYSYKLDEEIEVNSFLAYAGASTLLLQMPDEQFVKDQNLNQENHLYRLQYDQKKLDAVTLDEIASDGIELTLPKANQYVPQNLKFVSLCTKQQPTSYIQSVDVSSLYERLNRQSTFLQEGMPFYFSSAKECRKHEREYEEYNRFPHLIQKNLQGKTWWRLDRDYSPSVYAGLTFDTAISVTNREAQLKMMNAYITDYLRETMQQSFEAGYALDFDSNVKGLSLEMYGWSDKFEAFYEAVLKAINTPIEDSDRLERIKSQLKQDLMNTYEQKLFEQAIKVYIPQIIQSQPSPKEYISKISEIQIDQVTEFQKELLHGFRYNTYFTGNILRNDVEKLTSTIPKIFHESHSEIKFANHQTTVIDLSMKSIQYVLESESNNPADMNGLTLNYYQIGHRDPKSFSYMNLLSKQLHNAAYAYLRTQLQLGYVVNVRFRPVGCIDSAQIMVQGTAKPPHEVNRHIEEFLLDYGKQLRTMTDQQYAALQQATVTSMNENLKSLKDKGQTAWNHIKNNDLSFEEKEVAAQLIEQIKKEEIFDFYDKVFQSGKLSLQIYGKGMMSGIDQSKITPLESTQTFSGRQEILVRTQEALRSRAHRNLNCGYRISNIS